MNQKRLSLSFVFTLSVAFLPAGAAPGGANEGGGEFHLYLPAVRSDFDTEPPPTEAAVIVAAGDIVCGSATPPNPCEQQATSDTVLALGPDAVLGLGDLQYESGSYTDFMAYYDPTWGRFKAITHPAAGNHEYQDSDSAEGYFDYFNGIGIEDGPAGERGKGYYSFDLGAWHLIALNSNCAAVGGCQSGTAQEVWLRADLAAHPNNCTLAFWHHPRYTSGGSDGGAAYIDFWEALHDYGAEVVLVGHRHNYERYLPQDAWGNLDTATGITQFVVGTGGKSLTGLYQLDENSAVFNEETFGVLKMSLLENSYSWEFVPSAGGTFTDTGAADCH